ncbi:MAG: hypothetical protein ACJ77Z_20375 [Thermoleophilaceae bacterium]
MPRGRADIANTALRIFLQDMGAAYDQERGLEPYNGTKHFPEVPAFFGSAAATAGTTSSRAASRRTTWCR